MPDGTQFAQRILGKRDSRLVERVREIVFKDRYGTSVVLRTDEVSWQWG